jgi:ATP synthase protein I
MYLFRRPVLWALGAQVLVALSTVVCAWAVSGWAAAKSSWLGGLVALGGSLVYAIVADRPVVGTPLDLIRALVRAEAAKVLVVLGLLWTVSILRAAPSVVAFFSTFVLTVLAFSVAALVRDR